MKLLSRLCIQRAETEREVHIEDVMKAARVTDVAPSTASKHFSEHQGVHWRSPRAEPLRTEAFCGYELRGAKRLLGLFCGRRLQERSGETAAGIPPWHALIGRNPGASRAGSKAASPQRFQGGDALGARQACVFLVAN